MRGEERELQAKQAVRRKGKDLKREWFQKRRAHEEWRDSSACEGIG
jgi:hypothetical protein